MSEIARRLTSIREQIDQLALKAKRNPDEIRLVVVSKTRTVDEVRAAVDFGCVDFGENTLQDAMTKIPEFTDVNLNWHFIGHLQSNKTKHIPGNFNWLHTLDSLKLAKRLSDTFERSDTNDELQCLIQVNVSGEESKSGIHVDDLCSLVEQIQSENLTGIRLRGLMTIGVNADVEQTRNVFRKLKELQVKISQQFGLSDFDQLSMGMSGDYEIAIEEGATMIRLGTSVFGERSYSNR